MSLFSGFEVFLGIIVLVAVVGLVWVITEISSIKKKIENLPEQANSDTLQLRLQAYERITLLLNRLELKNLLSRVPNQGLKSKEMQQSLIQTIKQEYEYNVSQQIYIRPEIWKAITKIKEQNEYIINQLASGLPSEASAMDLNKHILDYIIKNPRNKLLETVNDAINEEVQKVMG